MTVHIRIDPICDRCGKPFGGKVVKYEEGLPKLEKTILVCTLGATPLFAFEDICPTCKGVVEGLIRRIRLDPEPKVKDKNEKADGKDKPEEVKGEEPPFEEQKVIPSTPSEHDF